MSVSFEEEANRRPYAPTANVLAVFNRIRSVNLPPAVDDQFLSVLGINPVAFGRVKGALRFLGLVDSNGKPTDALRALARAPDEEYRELLAGLIREAYGADFERVNPAEDTQARIVAAFQPYEPRSQTKRMVMLFLGLCRAASIPVLDAPRERQMHARESKSGRIRSRNSHARSGRSDLVPPADVTKREIVGSLLFGVTEDDVAALSETEFEEVWTALGKVARARARPRLKPAAPAVETSDDDGGDEERLV